MHFNLWFFVTRMQNKCTNARPQVKLFTEYRLSSNRELRAVLRFKKGKTNLKLTEMYNNIRMASLRESVLQVFSLPAHLRNYVEAVASIRYLSTH